MRLQRRVTFHFAFQFVALLIALFFITVSLFFLLANLATKEELKANPKREIIESIPINATVYNEDTFSIDEKWHDLLIENNMWFQFVNQDGEVFYSINTPDSLQSSYSEHDLLVIESTGEVDNYTVETVYDKWENDVYYYIFGFYNDERTMLEELYKTYNEQTNHKKLIQTLQSHNSYLDIYVNGDLVETIGESSENTNKPLDLIGRIHQPGKNSTKVFTHHDEKANVTWVLHLINKEYKDQSFWLLPAKETQIFLMISLISLFIAVSVSIWNGYRYGKPLITFVNWLEQMEKNHYLDVLTEKERRKIFKKNGKVKFRYRIFQEVFQSFEKMSAKLIAAEKERNQLEKTRAEWMTGISHDLRTPLSSVQGYGHLLESQQYTFSEAELSEMGKVIREKSDYIVQLLEDFSLVFQLKNSVITIEKQTIDLNKFVEKNVLKFKNDLTIQDKHFRFCAASDPCYADIDPKWFTRVLDNIISNAIKHNPPNTTIEVKVSNKADKAVIQVSDNGKGMDEDFAAKLFERYYRGTSTEERIGGEGLGMSIAHAIIQLHDGKIDVQSEIGVGTTITIII